MIRTDASTRFRREGASIGFGDLKIGQRVEAEGSPQPDGSLLAARVNVENAEKEDATKTPTVTGTPPTATPTRTPRPDDVMTRQGRRPSTRRLHGTRDARRGLGRREDEDLEGTGRHRRRLELRHHDAIGPRHDPDRRLHALPQGRRHRRVSRTSPRARKWKSRGRSRRTVPSWRPGWTSKETDASAEARLQPRRSGARTGSPYVRRRSCQHPARRGCPHGQ